MRTFSLHKRKPLYRRPRRYKRGDRKSDGLIFWAYLKGQEMWVTKERFDEAQEQIRKYQNYQ